jgi:26S proteasome regulatory subunit T5
VHLRPCWVTFRLNLEVDERPTETYTDIGGLEKQIEELVDAIVLPMEQAEKFKTIGIKPPKGCLMYAPPW